MFLNSPKRENKRAVTFPKITGRGIVSVFHPPISTRLKLLHKKARDKE